MKRFFAAHRSVRTVITMLTCLALGILVVPSAFAASSTGAHRISNSVCHPEPWGDTWCLTVDGVSTETITPSGKAIYTSNMTTTATKIDENGNVVSESSGRGHSVRVIKGEDMHVVADRFSSTINLADGTTCTYTLKFHEANGQVQFDIIEFECN